MQSSTVESAQSPGKQAQLPSTRPVEHYRFRNIAIPILDDITFLDKKGPSLGKGTYGEVYSFTYKEKECAVKIFTYKPREFILDVVDEMRIASDLGKQGIGPEVYYQGILTNIEGYQIPEEENDDDETETPSKKRKIEKKDDKVFVPFIIMEKYDVTTRNVKFFSIYLKPRMEALLMLAEKIEALHRLGLAHNDIKGSNALLKFTHENGGKVEKACIVDFGTVQYTGHVYGEFLDFVNYNPPEMVFGDDPFKISSEKGDVYQFVLIVWFSLFKKDCLQTMDPRKSDEDVQVATPAVFCGYKGYGQLENDIKNGNIRQYVAHEIDPCYRDREKIITTFTDLFSRNLQPVPEKRNNMSEIIEHIKTLCSLLK